ncbi:hypothetical protein ACJMQP_04090 [Rhodopseudomonas palustris]
MSEMETDASEMTFEPDEPARVVTRGRIVTKSELSLITGLAVVTIDRMIAEGAPIVAKGGSRKQGWQINTADFVGWYVRHKVAEATGDPDEGGFDVAKRRDKEAQARLREIEIAKREGELVPISDVEAWAAEKFGVVRSRFLAAETQVPGLSDEQRDALKAAISDAFSDVSGFAADNGDGVDDDYEFEDEAEFGELDPEFDGSEGDQAD